MAESREPFASILAFLLSTTITPPTCFRIPDVDGRVQGTAGQHLGISTQYHADHTQTVVCQLMSKAQLSVPEEEMT
jgi:hypothetical protein